MRHGYLMAIDAGTGSCRAVLFDLEGNQIAMSQEEWSHHSLPEYPGSQVFDTSKNWSLICKCIRNVITASGASTDSIIAVSATSMREGIVLYNKSGEEIWACPNVDSRAGTEAGSFIESGLAEKIYSISGDWVSITSAARLTWIRNNQPEIFGDIAKMTMISDWILYKLSGEYATDPSVGSSSGMFDLSLRSWSEEILTMCGLDRTILPPVHESGTMMGSVNQKAAQETRLRVGTPVVVGGADTQLGLIGIGRTAPDQFTILGGSFWQHTVGMSVMLIDPQARLRTLCHALPNQWMMEGIGFYCGLSMRWFRDAFCQMERDQAISQNQDPYVVMEKMAKEVPPGSNGVMAIFSNFMDAKRWIHASPSLIQFDILNPMQSGKKECIRAIQESAAYLSNGHMKIIEQITGTVFPDIVFSGGAAKGELWPQILADVLGHRISVPFVKESSALGTAIAAGVGVGIYNNLSDASSKGSKIERVFEPNPDYHEKYKQLFHTWSKTYMHSLILVEQGLAKPLWRAIGT
jgi:autoinducer 2 (AI-2) kinase